MAFSGSVILACFNLCSLSTWLRVWLSTQPQRHGSRLSWGISLWPCTRMAERADWACTVSTVTHEEVPSPLCGKRSPIKDVNRATRGCRPNRLVVYWPRDLRKGANAVLLVEANPHSLALIVQSLIALWLGLYIFTHGSGNRASGLAAAAMLGLSAYHIAASMLLNCTLRESAVVWARTMRLLGAPCMVLFLHMTVELLPPGRISWARRIVPLIYAWAIVVATIGAFTNLLWADVMAAPYIDRPYVVPGPLYPMYIVFMVTVASLCMVNLGASWRGSADPSLRRWFLVLSLAFFCMLVAVAYLTTILFLSMSWPSLLGHIFLGVCLMLLGYSLTQQSALVEGRALRRDFLYSVGSTGGGVVILFLLLLVLQRWTHQQVSAPTLIGLGGMMVSALSLQNWIRDRADVLLYRQEARRVRRYLRALARESDSQIDLGPRLRPLLDSLCEAVGATEGRIFLIGGEYWKKQVIGSGRDRSASAGHARDRAPSWRLAVPLLADDERIGSLVLVSEGEGGFTEEEHVLAQVLAERVVSILERVGTQAELLQRVSEAELATEELRAREQASQRAFLSGLAMLRERRADAEPERQLRSALRNLWDVPHLAKSALVSMPVVQSRLGRMSEGRALQETLLEAIDRAKPGESVRSDRVLQRYEILRRSFVGKESASEIAAALAMSERHYYRELNAALETLRAGLEEMNKEAEDVSAEAASDRARPSRR
jgi:hypothetical protein